jgi:hypothetical protein
MRTTTVIFFGCKKLLQLVMADRAGLFHHAKKQQQTRNNGLLAGSTPKY